MVSTHTPLFVEALDVYLLHFANRSPAVTPTYISSLILLIKQQLAVDAERGVQCTQVHFDATMRYIARKRRNELRFADLEELSDS